MRKIFKFVLPLLAIALLSLLLGQKAYAASPNSLAVFTNFQPWDGSSKTPLPVSGRATVVGNPSLNPSVPISKCPYDGYHLDVNGNNNACGQPPESNSTGWSTSGDFYGSATDLFSHMIWCGEEGGLNCGDLQVDVAVGGSSNRIVVDGVTRRGRWAGEWWRQGEDGETWVGFKTSFNGQLARIRACNPGLMVVSFTFIEDAPTGGALVSKYTPLSHPANGAYSDVDRAIQDSNIDLYLKDPKNGWSKFSSETKDPTFYPSLFTFLEYYIDVEVPPDWALKKATIKNVDVSVTDCRQVGNSRYCKIGLPGFTVKLAFTYYDYTYINLWFDQGLVGTICPSGRAIQQDKVFGDAFIEASPNNPPVVKVNIDGSSNVFTATTSTTKGPNGYYQWSLQIPDQFRDNQQHQVTAYLVDGSGNLRQMNIGGNPTTIYYGPSTSNNCSGPLEAYFYPWLQTERGNVVANGQINGQQDSPNLLGSIRYNGATNKEAEFLVISAVSGGGPFCSVYNYILTNEDALKSNCSNGTGYTVLNNPSLNIGGKDAVVQATLKAYSDMKSNNNGCAQDKTRQDMSMKSIDTSDCSSGAVYKLTGGNSLDTINVTRGRVTIYVDGDLYINGDITTDNSPVPLSQLPSLAIVANGKINIAPGVATIDAVLYGADKIDTCSDPNSVKCNLQLQINGMLVGKNGFSFDRTFFSKSSPGPAERVRFSPHSTVQVPPGIDSLYYRSVSSVPYKLDTSEYSPRF